jgi:hypothetical protein
VDPYVLVYRVIDGVELDYLRARGDYGSNPSRSGKYFALTIVGVQAFARAPMNEGTTITATALPQSVLLRATTFNDPGPHGAGLSVFFPEELLPVVYDTMRPPEIWKDADQ